jgi:hypothetical protein
MEEIVNQDNKLDVRERIKESILHVFRLLVDKPDEVFISYWSGEQTTVFEVSVPKDCLGQVIGKQGRTITAIREILKVVCGKEKLRAILNIKE